MPLTGTPIIRDVYKGEAVQSLKLLCPACPVTIPNAPHYTMDLDKCRG